MSDGMRAYVILTTLLLLGLVGMMVGNALFVKGMEREDPSTIGNIQVSARVVRPADIDRVIGIPGGENAARNEKARGYLVVRAWQRHLPAKSVLTMFAEIEEPAILRGHRFRIDGGFADEAKYHVEAIRLPVSGDYSDEQIRLMVSEPAVVRITKVLVK